VITGVRHGSRAHLIPEGFLCQIVNVFKSPFIYDLHIHLEHCICTAHQLII
jgi:hypothetical protein